MVSRKYNKLPSIKNSHYICKLLHIGVYKHTFKYTGEQLLSAELNKPCIHYTTHVHNM